MRKTVLMILVAAALGAYVYFYEIKGGEQREKDKAASEQLIQFEQDSINYMQIHTPFSEFEFARTMDGWQLTKPVKTKADESPVNTLLNSLHTAKKERSFNVPPNERAGFGLHQGSMQLELKGAGSEAWNLQFGDASGIGSNIYVTLGDSMVHLVPEAIAQNARKSLFQWRDKKALHMDKDAVRTIRYRKDGQVVELQKEGADWKMTRPLQTAADKSAVDGLLNKLDYGTISAVVSESADQAAAYRLINPQTEIELLIGPDKASKKISFSNMKGNEAFGRDASRPHIFKVDSTFMKPLLKSVFDLRDKTVCTFENNRVNRVVANYGTLQVELLKDSSNTWYGPDSAKAKSWRVNSWISAVKNTKATSFDIPVKVLKAQNADGSLQLYQDEDLLADLQLWATDDGKAWIGNNQTGLRVGIKNSDVKALFPERSELLESGEGH